MTAKIDAAEVERLAAEGLAQYQIAKALGVCFNTFKKYRESDPAVSDALKRGEAAAVGEVENALYKSAINGNLGAQVFFLKNRASDRWKDRTEQVRTVHAATAADLTDDELAEAVKG